MQIIEGTNYTREYTLLDQDDEPIPLAGATITLSFFLPGADDPTIEFTVGDGLTVTDAANGIVEAAFVPADTLNKEATYTTWFEVVTATSRTYRRKLIPTAILPFHD